MELLYMLRESGTSQPVKCETASPSWEREEISIHKFLSGSTSSSPTVIHSLRWNVDGWNIVCYQKIHVYFV